MTPRTCPICHQTFQPGYHWPDPLEPAREICDACAEELYSKNVLDWNGS